MPITSDLKTFCQLARQANWVPVWTTVSGDLLTPVSAYWKLTHSEAKAPTSSRNRSGTLKDGNYSFLFESVEGGENIARYTFLGAGQTASASRHAAPLLILKFWLNESDSTNSKKNSSTSGSGHLEIWEDGQRREETGDFLSFARRLFSRFRPARIEGLPPLVAGAVGYMGYDLISLQEPVKLPARVRVTGSETPMPDAVLMLFSTLLIFDHVKHQIWIVRNAFLPDGSTKKQIDAAYEDAQADIARVVKALESPAVPSADTSAKATTAKRRSLTVRSNTSRQKFLNAVVRAKEYIRAGDIFQVVLSQRLEVAIQSHPFEIYRALRRVNPAPYLFYMQLGKDCVLGSSPEMLVKVTGEDIEYRPIAGTRRRGATPEQDAALERELLADEKELAEHTMLVDLGRNDVGRVARYGTVKPARLKFIERYSHVMHLVSSIEGKLRPELDAWDALLACFPAGTVTGAPKVRAMQIISELEPTRRGIYAGTVLYYDLTGNLDSCIAIRSIVVRNGKASVQVGAGIVADSVPENEYEETMNKGQAMLAAIDIAEQQAAGAATRRRRNRK